MHFLEGKELEFKRWRKINGNTKYGITIFNYAIDYALAMEKELLNNTVLEEKDIFKLLSLKVNKKYDCTGFMVCCAVKILSLVWFKGDDLRKWFNSIYCYNGEGVVHNSLLKQDGITGKIGRYETELLLEIGEEIVPFMQYKYE